MSAQTSALRQALATPPARSRDVLATAARVLRRLAPHRRLIVVSVLLSLGGIATGVAAPRILGHATDVVFTGVIGRRLDPAMSRGEAIAAARARGDTTFADLLSGMAVSPGHGVDFTALGRTLALALGVYLLSAAMVWLQARVLNVTVQRTMSALRRDVEDKLHRLPVSYVDTRQRGELLSRVTNDVDNISVSVSMTISQLLTAVFTVVAVLAMMVSISPLLAGITVLAVPLSLLTVRTVTRRSRRLFAAQWAATGALGAHIEETYSGFTVVRTFGHRDAARAEFHRRNDELYRASFGAQLFSGLISPAAGFIGNLAYVAVAVVGGLQVATGQVSLGSIQAFIVYVRQFNQPLTQLAGMYNTLQSGMASAERVFDFLDEPEEQDTEVGVADHVRAEPPATAAPQVQFRHVGFGYRPGRPVLTDVSLTLPPGSTVALVGPTGAGKTTLVNLLLRFYDLDDDAGQILIDGVDITTLGRRALRSQIGVVSQDTWLFDGTIAENIGYGRPGAGHEEVVAAARAAHVDQVVRSLPEGYATRVGNDGGTLSAGEKQLITIARTMLSQPRLLVLDEATSSVDTRTELAVQQAITALRRGRTTLVIAHRLSTVRDADRIVVLDRGRVVEQGSPAELLARRGAYYAMTQA
ncbi:ABC transporter ATP-binding protein [Mycolicibacillus koreensis]|nr:ABC transporter ATP-binding protein [Mycolicibacillus koreensis]